MRNRRLLCFKRRNFSENRLETAVYKFSASKSYAHLRPLEAARYETESCKIYWWKSQIKKIYEKNFRHKMCVKCKLRYFCLILSLRQFSLKYYKNLKKIYHCVGKIPGLPKIQVKIWWRFVFTRYYDNYKNGPRKDPGSFVSPKKTGPEGTRGPMWARF